MADQVVVLTVRSQKVSGEKTFKLHKSRVVIGSSTSADVRLDDSSVSPIHAIFEVNGVEGKPVVYDLASETGIKVNGMATLQASLQANDQIQIGPYLLSVVLQDMQDPAREAARAPKIIKESFGQALFLSEKEDFAPLLLETEADVHEIFDERPSAKNSLQVVMFYNDTILDVEHFVDKKKVLIGPGTKEDFSIPPFLGPGKLGRFDLVTFEGGQCHLQIHEKMDGVINKGGKLSSIKEASTISTAGGKAIQLDDKDFAKVRLGDVSFFMNFTPAPPRLRPSRLFERDPLFAKIWFASLGFTLAMIFALLRIPVDPKIEIEQLPERVATILYETRIPPVPEKIVPKIKETEVPPPQKQETPPKKENIKVDLQPKPVAPGKQPKEIVAKPQKPAPKANEAKAAPSSKKAAPVKKASGDEGEGARAKGPEGQRGKVNAPPGKTPQDKALRPGPGKPTSTRPAVSSGRSQTDGLGVVDVFKENKGTLQKIFAGGKGAANSVDRLEGYSGITTKGRGGLGEAGSGGGGGGQSLGLGGLSDKGVGGGKRGTGLGALGSGGNILGSQGRISIDSGGSPEPVVLGGIDEDAIRRAVEAHRDEIKYCYEKEINAENPNLAGRISVRWVIGPSGSVSSAGVGNTSMRNANVERCVVDVIRRIQFPPVRGGGIAEVTYPFLFRPSNR